MWTYTEAKDFLARGRKKHERPLYDRGLRIWKINKWDPDSPIAIGHNWHGYHPFVIFHPDDTTIIQAPIIQTSWGGTWKQLDNYSTRLTIMRYAGISQLYRKDWKFYIVENHPRYTPSKIQGCRICRSSGKVDEYCSTITCWSGQPKTGILGFDTGYYECEEHQVTWSKQSNYSRWHETPCVHGNTTSHTIPKGRDCYYCSGIGKRDYGSKPETTQWDGSPLRLQHGNIIKSAATLLERMVADNVDTLGYV